MISSSKIQHEYNRLYKELRKYIWDFRAVEAIADLEISVYKLCPDLNEIQSNFDNLRYFTNELEFDDEDLSKRLNKFEDLIQSDDTPFAKLWNVKEVVQ